MALSFLDEKANDHWITKLTNSLFWRVQLFLVSALWGPPRAKALEHFLSALSADSPGQLDVLWHDGHTLGVDGAQVGVFEETDQVSLAGFLKGHDGGALESQISLEVLSDFTHQTLEGQLPDEELGALLVPSDFTESDCSGPVSVRFLHTTGRWCALPCSLGGKLFSWGFASSWFTSSLLSTGHCEAMLSQDRNYNNGDYESALAFIHTEQDHMIKGIQK